MTSRPAHQVLPACSRVARLIRLKKLVIAMLVRAFLAAARRGDFEGLLRVLDPGVRLTVDTPDGVVVTLGATEVAAGARLPAGAAARGRAVLVNGLPGTVSWREDGAPLSVIAFTVVDARIAGIAVVVDPARLASTDLPSPA